MLLFIIRTMVHVVVFSILCIHNRAYAEPPEQEILNCNTYCQQILQKSAQCLTQTQACITKALHHLACAEGYQAQMQRCETQGKTYQQQLDACDQAIQECRNTQVSLQQEVHTKLARMHTLQQKLKNQKFKSRSLREQALTSTQEVKDTRKQHADLTQQLIHYEREREQYIHDKQKHQAATEEAAKNFAEQLTLAQERGRQCMQRYYRALRVRHKYLEQAKVLQAHIAGLPPSNPWNIPRDFIDQPNFQCTGTMIIRSSLALGNEVLVTETTPVEKASAAPIQNYSFPSLETMCTQAITMCAEQNKWHQQLQAHLCKQQQAPDPTKAAASVWENSLLCLPPAAREEKIQTSATMIAKKNNWNRDTTFAQAQDGEVYADQEGYYWRMDLQHGRWEKFNHQTGLQEGEFDLQKEVIQDTLTSHKCRLSDLKIERLARGWVFRCTEGHASDLMVREERQSPSGFALMILSGFRTGCDLVHLPAESGSLREGLSTQWLLANWSCWVYPDAPHEQFEAFVNLEG